MFSARDFAGLENVSRETFEDFSHWKTRLDTWNQRINLVSPRALTDFWGRHALDSWQLWSFIPKNSETLLDLGSGAGFPGLAMAVGCKARKRGHVTLVESVGKKAQFLRTIIRERDLPATVWADRVEYMTDQVYDVITARAFAPLPRLLDYAAPFWGSSTEAWLLKGENVDAELTESQKTWMFDVETFESQSDPQGIILKLTGLQRREP